MSDPKGFLKWEREDSKKRPESERILDWKEFTLPSPVSKLAHQAGRCMDCGVAFCQSDFGCPVNNLIPDWNELVHEQNWKDALSRLHRTNNFPEFTGKLCPAPCESACVLGVSSSPVAIRSIESSIIERGFQENWVKPQISSSKSGKKVAIVGSGPAGLSAAQQLARLGHSPVVFEKADKIGGLLRYGIPDFKMEKWVLDRRLEQLEKEGVQFRTKSALGRDFTLETLSSEYDAVCLTIGSEKARDLNIAGRELKGVHFAMDYLIQQNRRVAGLPIEEEEIDARGKRVVIIGGGDTGSDCLGTVHRQGGLEVTQFEILDKPGRERSAQTPWPEWPLQLRSSHAHEEGGKREWSVLTTEFIGANGVLKGLKTSALRRVDGKFEKVVGSEREIPVDLVLLATGFEGPARLPALQSLKTDSRSNIQVDQKFRTSMEKVFAAGDVRRGASLIVWAIADGRKMAESVDEFLLLRSLRSGPPFRKSLRHY
jgi:glutamate synthase (NADPH/NADH) small chain